jgi:hypothetical protein
MQCLYILNVNYFLLRENTVLNIDAKGLYMFHFPVLYNSLSTNSESYVNYSTVIATNLAFKKADLHKPELGFFCIYMQLHSL